MTLFNEINCVYLVSYIFGNPTFCSGLWSQHYLLLVDLIFTTFYLTKSLEIISINIKFKNNYTKHIET